MADNPNWQITKLLYSKQVTVWCAISQHRIIGPFFWKDNNRCTVSVNSVWHEEMLKTFFSELKRCWVVLKWTWFQQDRAAPHATNLVIQCLKQKFGDCIIVWRAVFSRLPRSPDLKKKGIVRWDLEGSISSGYLAHCSNPFFMSIHIEFSASYSMLSQSLVTPTSLARFFMNPRVLSVSSEALMPITAILIPATDCVHLLHQFVTGPVTAHSM